MKQLTVRGVPDDLARELDRERRRRGQSLNRTVLDLLRRALGVTPEGGYDNGLGGLAGSWNEEEATAFDEAVAPFDRIDDEVWR